MASDEIIERGLDALRRELGPVGMIRFLQDLGAAKGDYTQERHGWLDDVSLEEIVEDIQAGRAASGAPPASP